MKPIVALLVLANVIVFGAMVWHTGQVFTFSGSESEEVYDLLAVIPKCLVECDARPTDSHLLITTLFSSLFVNGGLVHIAGNMIFLASIGGVLEERWGKGRFFLLYILMGLVATAAYVVLNLESETYLVGASGAIAGLIGSVVVLYPRARNVMLAASWLIVYNVLPLMGFGFAFLIVGTKNIAYEAHIGGFVAGLAIGLAFRLASRRPSPQPSREYV